MAGVFCGKVKKAEINDREIKDLRAKIGQLAVENDFSSQGLKYSRQGIAQQCPEKRCAHQYAAR